jgi:hypothetical protein
MAALVEMKLSISRYQAPIQNGFCAAVEYAYDKADPDTYFHVGAYGQTPEDAFACLAACVQDSTPQLSKLCSLQTAPAA